MHYHDSMQQLPDPTQTAAVLGFQGEEVETTAELDEPSMTKEVKDKACGTPVFVPIVVTMDDKDHKVMVEEWYSRQMVSISDTASAA